MIQRSIQISLELFRSCTSRVVTNHLPPNPTKFSSATSSCAAQRTLSSLSSLSSSPGLIYESASPFSSRSLSLIARYTLLGRAWTRLLLAISHSSRDLARAITARKLFGTVWHTRPIHRTRICIYSGPSFHEDFSWRWILTAKASQLERITRLFGILSGEPCRREDDVIIIVVLFFFYRDDGDDKDDDEDGRVVIHLDAWSGWLISLLGGCSRIDLWMLCVDIVGKGGVFLDIFVERMEQELKVIAVSECVGVWIYMWLYGLLIGVKD